MKPIAERIHKIKDSATVGIADKVTILRQKGGIRVIDFSAGRSFEATPDYVSQAASAALLSGDTHQTMARGTFEFRKACAKKLLRENHLKANWETEIIATMGVKQALTLACLSILNEGDEVLVEDPCFVSYQPIIQIAGGKPRSVPLKRENKFRWIKEQLQSAISKKTRAILINSPHNPTGTVHIREDLQMVADLAQEHDLFIITDEIYERATWNERQHICIATLPGMRERTITCMGLTKTFSMGGWRIGFVFASEMIIMAMEKLQQHLLTCVNSFTQAGAAVAFRETPKNEVIELWREWEERCEIMTTGLNEIRGLKCDKPEGGFYAWVDVTATGYTSQEFTDKLLKEAQVAVVPGSAFGPSGEGYIRINCVRNRDEIAEGLRRIRKILS